MKIHFIGIGGIGVSALAGFYLAKGHKVSGSDLDKSATTEALEKQGAKIFFGKHKAGNLPKDVDLVVYTAATEKGNLELKKAKELGTKTQKYAQALGDLTRQMFTIAVSGMHGKSTTTAMLGLVLEKAGLDPTVIVGTKLREWASPPSLRASRRRAKQSRRFEGNNFRVGKSQYLVIEADEYKASFLNYWPKILILTNIEEEHLDFYKNLDHIMATFRKYVSRLGKDGVLVANSDDINILKIKNEQVPRKREQISRSHIKIQNYSLRQKEAEEIRNILKVPGEHNISNALAVLAVAQILKIDDKITFEALANFNGTWRRMEYRGMVNGAKIYDDYGHHPTEIKATLEGARQLLWNSRRKPAWDKKRALSRATLKLWLVFQPHQYQRTHKLFKQFINAFDMADNVILLPIYSVPGREKESIKKKVNSEKIVNGIHRLFPERIRTVIYINSFQKAKAYLRKNLKKGDVCLIMGAGDVIKLTEMLLRY